MHSFLLLPELLDSFVQGFLPDSHCVLEVHYLFFGLGAAEFESLLLANLFVLFYEVFLKVL